MDVVFVRIGTARLGPGVLSEVLPCLHERETSGYGDDCIERIPSDTPSVAMLRIRSARPVIDLVLPDIPDVELLRNACDRFSTQAFLLVVAPVRLPRGTGSAVNPLAIF